MSEPTPSALVEALEKRAADAIERCELVPTIEDAQRRSNAALDRAAAAFIRSTMDAVRPLVKITAADTLPDDTRVIPMRQAPPHHYFNRSCAAEYTLGDLRRLRSLTGATDEAP